MEESNEVYHQSVTTIDTWTSQDCCCGSDSIDSSNGEYVYRDPIDIPTDAYAHYDLLIPIIITFNLGLVYYLLDTMDHTVDRLRTLLRSSLRLYDIPFVSNELEEEEEPATLPIFS
jgi:hypothetical protein